MLFFEEEMDKNAEILKRLQEMYQDAKPALQYKTPFQLLVAVILSAQCTDKRVNEVTKELFKKYDTPEAIAGMSQEELISYIFSCGFYNNKSKNLLAASREIVEKYGGQVPADFEALKKLPGVGQKTANVVWSVAFGGDAIAVDTHVFRVSNRLGLAHAKDVFATEEDLKRNIPKELWSRAHHWLIYHGRQVCASQRPKCAECKLSDLCDYYQKQTPMRKEK